MGFFVSNIFNIFAHTLNIYFFRKKIMKAIVMIKKLFELEFKSNTFADKKHENRVRKTIESFGIKNTKDSSIIKILKDKKNINKIVSELVDVLVYIEQPFGSQKSPDFIVCFWGLIIWIECKSGKKKITWNTGYPRENVLYVFSSKKTNNTTVFLGSLCEIYNKNKNFEKKYDEFDEEIKELSKKKFESLFESEKFSFYSRRMLVDKTDYSDQKLRFSLFEKTLEVFSNF